MERTEKIKVVKYTRKGMPLSQAVRFSQYPTTYIFLDGVLQSSDGMTTSEAEILIAEFEKYGVDVQVIKYETVLTSGTMEEALAKMDLNQVIDIPAFEPEPQEPEYPSSPYPRKEKRPRITKEPEPVATSRDWCLDDREEELQGHIIGRVKFRM